MPAKKGNTPDKIKNIARIIFLAHGFREASMQMIAAEVGISAPGLYKHFESKEEDQEDSAYGGEREGQLVCRRKKRRGLG